MNSRSFKVILAILHHFSRSYLYFSRSYFSIIYQNKSEFGLPQVLVIQNGSTWYLMTNFKQSLFIMQCMQSCIITVILKFWENLKKKNIGENIFRGHSRSFAQKSSNHIRGFQGHPFKFEVIRGFRGPVAKLLLESKLLNRININFANVF